MEVAPTYLIASARLRNGWNKLREKPHLKRHCVPLSSSGWKAIVRNPATCRKIGGSSLKEKSRSWKNESDLSRPKLRSWSFVFKILAWKQTGKQPIAGMRS